MHFCVIYENHAFFFLVFFLGLRVVCGGDHNPCAIETQVLTNRALSIVRAPHVVSGIEKGRKPLTLYCPVIMTHD